MKATLIFPTILIALDIGAAVVYYEAQALVRKYSPPEDEATPASDDSMPF